MKIQSGIVKANKKDIEAIKIFLFHAKQDMSYGWDGSYGGYNEDDERAELRMEKELEEGKHGMECVEFLLKGLCDKWI